jgi:hypothetical protein
VNITINTATITQGDREVLLTRVIVVQLPFMRDKWTIDEVKCIGSVLLNGEVIYLMATPEGVCQCRYTPNIKTTDNGNIKRIVLIK